jgi:hypothetical protein
VLCERVGVYTAFFPHTNDRQLEEIVAKTDGSLIARKLGIGLRSWWRNQRRLNERCSPERFDPEMTQRRVDYLGAYFCSAVVVRAVFVVPAGVPVVPVVG